MFTDIILIIIGVCIIALLIISIRKFPNAAAVDVKTIPEEQQLEVKEQILIDRFRRVLLHIKDTAKELIQPGLEILTENFQKFYKRILEMEKRYEKSAKHSNGDTGENVEQKISHLLREAGELITEDKFGEAEKKYISVISLDIKNIDAYDGLVDIYLENKEYEQALETLIYLIRINPENPNYFIELGEVHQILGNYDKMLENAREAVKITPNNPRALDFLIASAILLNNKKLAENTLKKLEKSNPENEKLPELREKIKNISK